MRLRDDIRDLSTGDIKLVAGPPYPMSQRIIMLSGTLGFAAGYVLISWWHGIGIGLAAMILAKLLLVIYI